jgi:hypothetical protein
MWSIRSQILPWKMKINFLQTQTTKQFQFKSEYQAQRGSRTWHEEYSTAEIGKTGPEKQVNLFLRSRTWTICKNFPFYFTLNTRIVQLSSIRTRSIEWIQVRKPL